MTDTTQGGEAPLVPILVDGSGRDGTTLMMQLFGTSVEIAFDRIYPFEQRYFSYLLHWSQLPTLDGWEKGQWSLDSLAHSKSLARARVVGPLPWVERSLIEGNGTPAFWQETFEAAWAAFSARARSAVRSRIGDAGQPIRYYAQKNGHSWALPFEGLPSMRLVCMLRDPRDVWMSSLAFHRRRVGEGDTFLAIGPRRSEEEELSAFIETQRERLRWLSTVEAKHGAPVIRYESMVRDLPAEAARLGGWLGTRLDAEAVLRRRAEFAAHITSENVEQSVGRWRREMSADLAARFWGDLGDELAGLGYEA